MGDRRYVFKGTDVIADKFTLCDGQCRSTEMCSEIVVDSVQQILGNPDVDNFAGRQCPGCALAAIVLVVECQFYWQIGGCEIGPGVAIPDRLHNLGYCSLGRIGVELNHEFSATVTEHRAHCARA